MQGFWQKFKFAVQRFMVGRHGVDQLSIALLYGAVAVNLLSLIPGLGVLSTVSLAMLVYAVFRIYSKNNVKRYAENAWYLKRFGGMATGIRQAALRFKNRKNYVYFDCPSCHAKLRLPRGKGEVTVTCGRCGHAFRKQA